MLAIANFTPGANQTLHRVSLLMEPKAQRQDAGLSDAGLVRQTLAGDRSAFDELIGNYQRQAVAVAYRLLGNTDDALEVTQEAFLKAFANLRSLRQPEAFGGWLMRIVSNLALNFRRGRKSHGQLAVDDLLESGEESPMERAGGRHDPAHHLASAEMGRQIHEALGRLPEKQRLAIIMFTMEQMPQKQVAQALGWRVGNVKWHVFQAREKLREMLKEYL